MMNGTIGVGLALVLVFVGGFIWMRATLASQVWKVAQLELAKARVRDADELRARQDMALGGIRALFADVQRHHAKLVEDLRQRALGAEAGADRRLVVRGSVPGEHGVTRTSTLRTGVPVPPQPAPVVSEQSPTSPRLPASMDVQIADRYEALRNASRAAGEPADHCESELCSRSPSMCRCQCPPCRRALALLLQAQSENR
jgi:hypothetical protein